MNYCTWRACSKVVGSRPEKLVDSCFTLMLSGSPAGFQHVLEVKACYSQSS